MRRILFASLLLATACLTATSPTSIPSLTVQSNAPSTGVFVGDQVQLNATAIDVNGNTLAVAFTYTSSDTVIATISTAGLIVAAAPGQSTITVSGGGQTIHLTLTVDGNVPGAVTMSAPTATIVLGAQTTLAATVTTTLGNPARNKTLTWSSADATRVSVDQTGTVSGLVKTSGIAVCAAPSDSPAVRGCTTVIVQ